MKSEQEFIESFYFDLNKDKDTLLKRIVEDEAYFNQILNTQINRREFQKVVTALLFSSGIFSLQSCNGILGSRTFRFSGSPLKFSYAGTIISLVQHKNPRSLNVVRVAMRVCL
ncbi:MAG: hypothetical protein PF517_19730 [Salinivirgaceae bacterium]|jgi:hypothetical protein|nr:hypothetical protein [Salinivirgaceae bacterium]